MNKVNMVIDNFFDDLFLHQLFEKVVDIPIAANNIANRKTWPYGNAGSHRLFGSMLFYRKSLNNVTILEKHAADFLEMLEAIEERVLQQKIFLNYISLNVQTAGMDGTQHKDSEHPEDATMLIMLNPIWNKEWGGEFQILDDEGKVIEEYEYKPGRILIFPSAIPHRGLAPTEKYIIRYTAAYRIAPIKNHL